MTKTILVTGATDGIGLLAAQKLSKEGHRVLLHGRNAEKLARAAEALGGAATYRADLSKMGDVVAMADAVTADHARLDVLVNNAGILKSPETRTEAGRDIRFDVNAVAPFVLAKRLLPLIPPEGRIVNISSAAQAPVDIAAMTGFQPMQDMDAYAQSKLAITIWSDAMAKDMPDGPVVVSVNPGSLLATKMVKEGFGIAGNDVNIGADIILRAAVGADFAEASGMYYDTDAGRFAPPHAAAADPAHVAAVMGALADMSRPFV